MDLPNAIGKSSGSSEACTVAVTVPFDASSCLCVVYTGPIYSSVACEAVMVPNYEGGGIDQETGKYPESVKISWTGTYVFSSSGTSMSVEQPAAGDCLDNNGSCSNLRVTP